MLFICIFFFYIFFILYYEKVVIPITIWHFIGNLSFNSFRFLASNTWIFSLTVEFSTKQNNWLLFVVSRLYSNSIR